MFSFLFFSYFSYLFLFLSFLILGVSYYITGNSPSDLYYGVFLVLLFPFGDMLFSSLRDDGENPSENKKLPLQDAIFACILFVGAAIMWVSGQHNPIVYLLYFTSILLLASWESRLFFIGAMILLCYVVVSLLYGLQSQAEILSIYVYYMLVLGVFSQILQQFRFFKR